MYILYYIICAGLLQYVFYKFSIYKMDSYMTIYSAKDGSGKTRNQTIGHILQMDNVCPYFVLIILPHHKLKYDLSKASL